MKNMWTITMSDMDAMRDLRYFLYKLGIQSAVSWDFIEKELK